MFFKPILSSLIGAVIAGPSFALAAVPSVLAVLAAHPQCTADADRVYVRGAVATVENGAPVPGASVCLKYGNAVRFATTDADGIYHAAFARSEAREVREVSTSIAAPTGTLVPVKAREGTGACVVAGTSVGELQPVR